MTTTDVLLLGAAGNSGRLIAAELAARGLSVRLAGRRRDPLDDLVRTLAAGGAATGGVTADVRTVDVSTVDLSDAASLAEAMAGAGLVLSTIGPFARQAGPVIDACLAAGVSYVDIANEWAAVRGLLDRGDQARAHEVTLVTGAGFGPAATETLVLRLVGKLGTVPGLVRVAAAAEVTNRSDGVRQTIQESLSGGTTVVYRDDQVVREALGSGAAVLTFGGTQRRMLPGPVGDLETARLASGAPNVVAYIADPAAPGGGNGSYAWAEAVGPDGQALTAELRAGEGVQATAAIAAETARRVLAGARPGAWTPGQLFGAALVTDATGAQVTVG
ncbi:MAG TPA: saccharopine dehydrogenase NADP-binding domain-containing protein [Streptosporangiaceae bacterium]|nr:saccharopine dehydrogenase NADP-binding domain-containing protein [Streptosporangiaceae bacterium]